VLKNGRRNMLFKCFTVSAKLSFIFFMHKIVLLPVHIEHKDLAGY